MELNELATRFTYHPVKNTDQAELYSSVRAQALDMAIWLCTVAPESRELSLALTKLEEVVFWTNAAIARR